MTDRKPSPQVEASADLSPVSPSPVHTGVAPVDLPALQDRADLLEAMNEMAPDQAEAAIPNGAGPHSDDSDSLAGAYGEVIHDNRTQETEDEPKDQGGADDDYLKSFDSPAQDGQGDSSSGDEMGARQRSNSLSGQPQSKPSPIPESAGAIAPGASPGGPPASESVAHPAQKNAGSHNEDAMRLVTEVTSQPNEPQTAQTHPAPQAVSSQARQPLQTPSSLPPKPPTPENAPRDQNLQQFHATPSVLAMQQSSSFSSQPAANGDTPSNDIESLWKSFNADERRYMAEAKWDKFPEGSRVFIGSLNSKYTHPANTHLINTGNLSSERVSKRDVFEIFHKFGRLAQVSLKSAYGFVQYFNAEDARVAIQTLQDTEIKGQRIHLEVSKVKKKKTDTRAAAIEARQVRAPDRIEVGRGPHTNNKFDGPPDRRNREDSRQRGRGQSSYRDRNDRPDRDRDGRSGRGRGPSGYHYHSDYYDDGYQQNDYHHSNGYRQSGYDHGSRGRSRGRSRSPDRYGRSQEPYRSRSPYGHRHPAHLSSNARVQPPVHTPTPAQPPQTTDEWLPIQRRRGDEVPDVQILLLEDVPREFIQWTTDAFEQRHLKVAVMFLAPHLPRDAVMQRQAIEGVHGIVDLDKKAHGSGKLAMRVFDRSQGPKAEWNDYKDIAPHVAAELIVRSKGTARFKGRTWNDEASVAHAEQQRAAQEATQQAAQYAAYYGSYGQGYPAYPHQQAYAQTPTLAGAHAGTHGNTHGYTQSYPQSYPSAGGNNGVQRTLQQFSNMDRESIQQAATSVQGGTAHPAYGIPSGATQTGGQPGTVAQGQAANYGGQANAHQIYQGYPAYQGQATQPMPSQPAPNGAPSDSASHVNTIMAQLARYRQA